MWLAEKAGAEMSQALDIQIGRVTIGGARPAVMLDGEKRNVNLALPEGYGWTPEVGDEVLVVKSEGEWFITAKLGQAAQPATGEVGIYSVGARVAVTEDAVKLDGDVEITGSLKINGVDIYELLADAGGI